MGSFVEVQSIEELQAVGLELKLLRSKNPTLTERQVVRYLRVKARL
jgi:hypothetical protein